VTSGVWFRCLPCSAAGPQAQAQGRTGPKQTALKQEPQESAAKPSPQQAVDHAGEQTDLPVAGSAEPVAGGGGGGGAGGRSSTLSGGRGGGPRGVVSQNDIGIISTYRRQVRRVRLVSHPQADLCSRVFPA
jgi:hypothetical protein